jgi:NAD(P)-dependent dehydrogenase (short-subunit alcohol dehydrogenase family)
MAAKSSAKAVLITGANAGLGKEVARQLALGSDFDRIYLGCRHAGRSNAAKADLERATNKTIFEVILMDLDDLDSVRAAIGHLGDGLHSLVMNASGACGSTPMARTADGVTEIFASNVLGHVVLLAGLITAKSLSNTAVYVGREAARRVPKLRIPRPTFADSSVDELVSAIDGSFFDHRKFASMLAYGQVKYLGALWMSALARKHPDLRLVTMSPGNTARTDALRSMGTVTRILMSRVLMPYVFHALHIGQTLENGAKRLVDAVTQDGFRSGVFYASAASAVIGPVVDQAEIVADFDDAEL